MDNQEQNDQANKPAFKPAKNPFLSAVGLGTKQPEEPPKQQTREVAVGNKATTLVGTSAEDKAPITKAEQPQASVPEETLYQWQAPEFSYTHKPLGWYVGIFGFFAVLVVLAFFFLNTSFQKWITIGLLVVMAVATSVWASRKPKVLSYEVTNYGIAVNNKKYNFDDFRAFYEYMDYNQHSIDLVPGKRFGTLVSLPLATPEADDIIETIAHMVPEIEHNEDIIDRLVRRLRF